MPICFKKLVRKEYIICIINNHLLYKIKITNKKMETTWKKLNDYPQEIEVSNTGIVRYLNGKILKQYLCGGAPGNRYFTVKVKKADGKWTNVYVHRLVAQLFLEKPEGTRVVNHKNHNTHDNRVENLEWTTQSHNVKTRRNYTRGKGLSQRVVTELRLLYDTGRFRTNQLARMYKITPMVAWNVVNRNTYTKYSDAELYAAYIFKEARLF